MAISVVALREVSRIAAAAAEYQNQREKRRMFRLSTPLVAIVVAAALPTGFTVSFQAGSRDDVGRFMGGTEMRVLVGHAGKLYAGNGYWEDTPGPEGRQGTQILVLDAPGARWLRFRRRIRRGSGRTRAHAKSAARASSARLPPAESSTRRPPRAS